MLKPIGRFAPSPSGCLHFGSFITALASYLQAKSVHGLWLVRIEDLDPPREVTGAATKILDTLEQLGLCWDQDVRYQSTRLARYREIVDLLITRQHAYYCDCSRQRIQGLAASVYDNHCQNRQLRPIPNRPMAIRLKQEQPVTRFLDYVRGWQYIGLTKAQEDFIIRRRDGLFAYNLAVVIDDHEQGITQVVRGADLISVTTKQMSLYQQLGWSIPDYYHLPLVLDGHGNKLSKQNHAPAITRHNISQLIVDGLQFLGQPIPQDWQDATKEQLLQWAIRHWNSETIPRQDKQLLTADKR